MNVWTRRTSAAAASSVTLAENKQGARNLRGVTTEGVGLQKDNQALRRKVLLMEKSPNATFTCFLSRKSHDEGLCAFRDSLFFNGFSFLCREAKFLVATTSPA